MPRRLTVSIRIRSACGRVSGFSWNVAFVWPFTWQSKHVTPRLGVVHLAVFGLVELLLRIAA